ncbi:hypothetical protein AVEN_256493-1 [Araneus ventricosus]|uniref:Uncharacterized protein n=1 Tax=Araneus ventricosus TaxID=182803 RepID=A0A4Y2WXC8_ARAVE|nr:hypothetical protein AVEN_256493-1 [Araneus ventricosus]
MELLVLHPQRIPFSEIKFSAIPLQRIYFRWFENLEKTSECLILYSLAYHFTTQLREKCVDGKISGLNMEVSSLPCPGQLCTPFLAMKLALPQGISAEGMHFRWLEKQKKCSDCLKLHQDGSLSLQLR